MQYSPKFTLDTGNIHMLMVVIQNTFSIKIYMYILQPVSVNMQK